MLTDKDLNDATIEELTELKSKITSFIKDRKEGEKERKVQEKEERALWAKDNLEVGDVVNFTYKGEELEGEITKLNDKSFTAAFEYGGEDKVLPRLYHFFISRFAEEETTVA